MLVFAPAACIMSGIALSEAFDVFARSIKFQLPALPESLRDEVAKRILSHSNYLINFNSLVY